MAESDRIKWERRYAAGSHPETEPEELVVEACGHARVGRALDVACGRGRHAIYLARRGFSVDAIDVSPTALALAHERAGDLRICWIEADLGDAELERGVYDLVVCAQYTEERLVPALLAALAPGGVLAFVARPRALCRYGPEPGRVAEWFAELECLAHREGDAAVEFLGKRC